MARTSRSAVVTGRRWNPYVSFALGIFVVGLALTVTGCGSGGQKARTEVPEIPAREVVPQVPPTTSPTPPPPPPLPLPQAPRQPSPPSLPAPTTRVRVGLATDLENIVLPCCDGVLRDGIPPEDAATGAAFLEITPAPETVSLSTFRLQVAALKDEGQAQALAARLERTFEAPAEARFDAGQDLYRVRLGNYPSREAAERARGRLAAAGFGEAWVVGDGGGLRKAALVIRRGDQVFRVEGRRFLVRSPGGEGISWQGTRYRDRLVVFLNDRGRLNLINELSLEDYLRGVVPKEMGPLVYGEIEALKAQAVAARSYTLRHLGEFEDDGYDICATPRCHVYGGLDGEQPLTDQAIVQTAGEVLTYDHQVADTLYTATCGGGTENVQVVFPGLKDRPYLQAVRCLEDGIQRLSGAGPAGEPFPGALLRALVPGDPGRGPGQLGRRILGLAKLAGLAAPADRLGSFERREVLRFVASVFDLALDARLFVSPEEVAYLIANPPAGWGKETLRQAAYLVQSGLVSEPLDGVLGPGDGENLLLQLALLLRVVEKRSGGFERIDSGLLSLHGSAGLERYDLPEHLATFRRQSGRERGGDLTLVAGDRLDLYLSGGRLLAVVQEIHPGGMAFDRGSRRRAWRRFHSDAQLRALVQERYPGLGFRGFEVLERGVSGRVGKIRLDGDAGKSVMVEGLAVRWTLGLPETLFTATRLTPKGSAPGWLFRGRGWGHGVGMCQEGAFGMAQRGHGYREILGHYYPGTSLSQLPTP